MAVATPILDCTNVSKKFGAVQALYKVDFEVAAGEVMALVGDNGAGKSTLIKGIAGIYVFYEGEIHFEGKRVNDRRAPAIARRSESRSSTRTSRSQTTSTWWRTCFSGANGSTASSSMRPEWRRLRGRPWTASRSTSLRSVRQAVAGLSGGQRQAVAVAKAVMWNSRVVILDEPTAALGVAQTRQVLDLVRRLADRGLGVVIVTHNLHDVFEVADRITVLRLGQRVETVARKDVTQQEVVHAITAGQLQHVPGMAAETEL